MKVNQVIAMWKLVADNSFLLKALLTAAGFLFVISLLPKWHPIMVASIFLSLVSLFFANILLIANAAKLTDSKHIQILPNYRPIMLVMFLGWFLAILLYFFLLIQLTVTHDRADITSNNNDDTFKERVYKEGSRDKEGDLHHIKMWNARTADASKLPEHLLLGHRAGQFSGKQVGTISSETKPSL